MTAAPVYRLHRIRLTNSPGDVFTKQKKAGASTRVRPLFVYVLPGSVFFQLHLRAVLLILAFGFSRQPEGFVCIHDTA